MIRAKYFLTAMFAGIGAMTMLAGCTSPDAGTRSASAPTAAENAPQADHADHEGHEDHGKTMDHTMGISGLESLRKLPGKDFDIAFLSQMIAHHEAAVVMAEQALKTAKDEAVLQDARQVVTAQTGEIKQMTDWLQQWHGVEPSREQQALVNADMESMMAMPVTSGKMFYEMMIPHHQGAIDMSELALEKAERPEVKKLAEQIIRDQKAEIASYQKKLQ